MVIDHLRKRNRQPWGHTDAGAVEPEAFPMVTGLAPSLVLAIDEALNRLEVHYPRRAQITLLRFFGGFTLEEVADVLEVSVPTVKREWRLARMWFANEFIEFPPTPNDC